ncbi:MAG: hypothetical protein ACHQRK_08770 [Gemmatimonadales bacterium]
MKFRMSGAVAVLFATVATVIWSCGSSASSGPTPTSTTQVIWQNGALGCWASNCGTGGMTISDQFTTHRITASNTLEIDGMPQSGSGVQFGSWLTRIKLLNTENQSGYAGGHLQFDIMLAQPASAYAGIGVSTGNGCPNWVLLSPGSLSQTGFTHISVPLSTCTINYPTLFVVTLTGNAASSLPVLYFNNIEWTTD